MVEWPHGRLMARDSHDDKEEHADEKNIDD
jgi:hypothetical protein